MPSATIRLSRKQLLELPHYDHPRTRYYHIHKWQPEQPLVVTPEFRLPKGWRVARTFQHLGWLMAELTDRPAPAGTPS